MSKSWLAKARRHWLVLSSAAVYLATSLSLALTRSIGTVPDEAYHYGAIQQQARFWGPVISQQTDIATTGDITRNPSYFYHYVMSFPYRFMDALGWSDSWKLHGLRLLTVGLGLVTIWLLYRLLRQVTKTSIAAVATSLFSLLPITTVVFAGPNYDNLLLPITFLALGCLISFHSSGRLSTVLWAVVLLLLGCLVKFAFGPVAIGGLVWAAVSVYHGRNKLKWSFFGRGRINIILASLCLLTVVGLGIERYGLNVVRYGNPQPACQKVQPLADCRRFSIYERNYQAKRTSANKPKPDPVTYTAKYWLKYMLRGLAYPSPWLKIGVILIGIYFATGLIAWAIFRQSGFRPPGQGIWLIGISLFYIATVFFENYHTIRQLGEPYAINGRYLLPVLPLLMVTMATNIRSLQQRLRLKGYLLSALVLAGLALVNIRTIIN